MFALELFQRFYGGAKTVYNLIAAKMVRIVVHYG
jgi:hypothetical protein